MAVEALRERTTADASSIDSFRHQLARCLQVPFEQHLDVRAYDLGIFNRG